jgi:hypothetical protein
VIPSPPTPSSTRRGGGGADAAVGLGVGAADSGAGGPDAGAEQTTDDDPTADGDLDDPHASGLPAQGGGLALGAVDALAAAYGLHFPVQGAGLAVQGAADALAATYGLSPATAAAIVATGPDAVASALRILGVHTGRGSSADATALAATCLGTSIVTVIPGGLGGGTTLTSATFPSGGGASPGDSTGTLLLGGPGANALPRLHPRSPPRRTSSDRILLRHCLPPWTVSASLHRRGR